MRLFSSILSLLLLVLITTASYGDESTRHQQADPYLEHLLALAEEKALHQHRYWHILLHYEKNIFGRVRSIIDDPDFFLAPEGKHSPREELKACIRTFFRAGVTADDFSVCGFIARYTWLKEVLSVDGSRVPLFTCDSIDALTPRSATLVFPTYFMNNPASMFGHTLIAIEMEYASTLLNKAVNYAATTDDTSGPLFAVKGLFGLYKGYYSIMPYYMKIQEYSDMSQRDIWEYRLNLTVPELERMVRHIRELEGIYADYFFFDENCSYKLFYLLEAARPSARLTDRFNLWVIPVDTIRAVDETGMIESAVFRPSRTSRIRHKISLLSEENRDRAMAVFKGVVPPSRVIDMDTDQDEQKTMLDLVSDYAGYHYAKGFLEQEPYQQLLLETLKVRSGLGPRESPYDPPPPPQPDQGHASRKLDAETGISHRQSFFEIGFRPAFSDLLDTTFGHHQGAQIKFFETRLRYYASDEKLVLSRLSAVDILSISPRDRFFKPFSWKISADIRRQMMADGREDPVFRLNTGGGMAWYNRRAGLYYAFFEPVFLYGTDLDDHFALGAGLSAGSVFDLTDWWRCRFHAEQFFFTPGENHRQGRISLWQNFSPATDHHLRVKVSREKIFDHYNTEVSLSWCLFF